MNEKYLLNEEVNFSFDKENNPFVISKSTMNNFIIKIGEDLSNKISLKRTLLDFIFQFGKPNTFDGAFESLISLNNSNRELYDDCKHLFFELKNHGFLHILNESTDYNVRNNYSFYDSSSGNETILVLQNFL